jgi:hypothetical protein
MLTQQVGLRQQSLNDQIVAGEGMLGDGSRTSRLCPEPEPNPFDDEQACCRKSSALLCDLTREG